MTKITLFIRKNKKCIGYSIFYLNSKIATITDVYIDEPFRGQGYGTKLVKSVIKYIKKYKKISQIELDDMSDIHGINNIYYKCGFRYKKFNYGPEMVYKI